MRLSGSPRPDDVGDYVLKGGWYTLWIMIAVNVFGVIDRQVLVLAAAPIATSLGLSDSQLGMVQGLAFAIFAVTAVYPIAWAADRFDRRFVMGACVCVWSLGTAACGFARNFEQLLLAGIAVAAGEAALGPLAQSYVPELFKGRKRLLANGITYVLSFAGISTALVLCGSAIGAIGAIHGELPVSLRQFEPWRLAFFVMALPAPLLIFLLAFTRLDHERDAAEPGDDGSAKHPFWPFILQNWRAMATVFVGLSLASLPPAGYATWIAVATTRMFGATPAQNGAAMGLTLAVGMIAGVLTGTFVVRGLIVRMGPVASIRFFWVALLLAMPAPIAFPFVSAAWQAFALFGVTILLSAAIGCMMATVLQDMAPAHLRARMFAVWSIVFGLMNGAAPSLVGWLSSALGRQPRMLPVALSIVAIPIWIAAIVLLRMAERPFRELLDRIADMERSGA
jgi:MFS family permease